MAAFLFTETDVLLINTAHYLGIGANWFGINLQIFLYHQRFPSEKGSSNVCSCFMPSLAWSQTPDHTVGDLHAEPFCTFSDSDSARLLQQKLQPTPPLFVYTEPVSNSPLTVARREGCFWGFLGGSSLKTRSGGLRVTA